MTRRWTLVLALILLPLTGCIGGGGGVEMDETVTENNGCSVISRDATIVAGQPLVLTLEAGGTPATASIDGTTSGVGELQLVLEHNGTEVWSDTEGGTGAVGMDAAFDGHVEGLARGDHTLTISASEGYHDMSIAFEIRWGGGTCS